MTAPNRKILVLSIVLSISLFLRAINDVLLISINDTWTDVDDNDKAFAVDLVLYYLLLEIIPFCLIVYIITNTREGKISPEVVTDDERGHSLLDSVRTPS